MTLQFSRVVMLGSIGLLSAVFPVFAGQETLFGSLTLNGTTKSGVLSGSTGGGISLPAVVSNVDRNGNACIGFGDDQPDHQLILKQDFPRLQLRVNSGGADTTLVVQGPGGVRCGDNSGAGNRDASINDTDWSAGTYNIWVGTATPRVRRNYTLTVK
jgi:hypothetical protein